MIFNFGAICYSDLNQGWRNATDVNGALLNENMKLTKTTTLLKPDETKFMIKICNGDNFYKVEKLENVSKMLIYLSLIAEKDNATEKQFWKVILILTQCRETYKGCSFGSRKLILGWN